MEIDQSLHFCFKATDLNWSKATELSCSNKVLILKQQLLTLVMAIIRTTFHFLRTQRRAFLNQCTCQMKPHPPPHRDIVVLRTPIKQKYYPRWYIPDFEKYEKHSTAPYSWNLFFTEDKLHMFAHRVISLMDYWRLSSLAIWASKCVTKSFRKAYFSMSLSCISLYHGRFDKFWSVFAINIARGAGILKSYDTIQCQILHMRRRRCGFIWLVHKYGVEIKSKC